MYLSRNSIRISPYVKKIISTFMKSVLFTSNHSRWYIPQFFMKKRLNIVHSTYLAKFTAKWSFQRENSQRSLQRTWEFSRRNTRFRILECIFQIFNKLQIKNFYDDLFHFPKKKLDLGTLILWTAEQGRG